MSVQLLVCILLFSVVSSKGTLSLLFNRYTESHKCDTFGQCDLYFKITVTGASSKYFETPQQDGGDNIYFDKDIGVQNPVDVAFATNGSVTVLVEVWDKDMTGNDDKIRIIEKTLDYKNLEQSSTWNTVTVSHHRTQGDSWGKLTMKYRIKSCNSRYTGEGCAHCSSRYTGEGCAHCSANYYSADCAVRCEPQQTLAVNYTCNPESGGRECGAGRAVPDCELCDIGYYQPNCSIFCQAVPGRYTCTVDGTKLCSSPWRGPECDTCSPSHYGPNCDVICSPAERYTCSETGGKLCVGNTANPASNCADCKPLYYGDNCAVFCDAGGNPNYTCNNEGVLTCSTHRIGEDCSHCMPDHYTSTCGVYCSPTALYTCHQETGEKICRGGHRAGANCDRCAAQYHGPWCVWAPWKH